MTVADRSVFHRASSALQSVGGYGLAAPTRDAASEGGGLFYKYSFRHAVTPCWGLT
uniref:hypothetical protein n=1 Tax=Polynucleobacter sp. TaxID=2029855 RepID=UPI004047D31E